MRKILFIALLVISALVSAQDGKTIYELNQKIDVQDDTITAVRGRLVKLTDQVAPTLAWATSTEGAIITGTSNENLDETSVPDSSDFDVYANEKLKDIDSVAISGLYVYIYLTDSILSAEATYINHDPGTNKMKDEAGNEVSAFFNKIVNNKVSIYTSATLEVSYDFEQNLTDGINSYDGTGSSGFGYSSISPIINNYKANLDGANKYATVPQVDLTDTFTIFTGFQSWRDGDTGVIAAANDWKLMLNADSGRFIFQTGTKQATTPANVWNYGKSNTVCVLVNKTDSTAKFYINGTSQIEDSTINGTFTTNDSIRLGIDMDGNHQAYSYLDGWKLLTGHLTSNEIDYTNEGYLGVTSYTDTIAPQAVSARYGYINDTTLEIAMDEDLYYLTPDTSSFDFNSVTLSNPEIKGNKILFTASSAGDSIEYDATGDNDIRDAANNKAETFTLAVTDYSSSTALTALAHYELENDATDELSDYNGTGGSNESYTTSYVAEGNYAADFDGSDKYITVGEIPYTSTFTIGLRVQSWTSSSDNTLIDNASFRISLNGSTGVVNVNTVNTGTTTATSTSGHDFTSYKHIGVIFYADSVGIYIDGDYAVSDGSVQAGYSTSGNTRFGARLDGTVPGYSYVDDIVIYSDTATTDEITYIANNPGERITGGISPDPKPNPDPTSYKVHFAEDFEDESLGWYSTDNWNADFNNPGWRDSDHRDTGFTDLRDSIISDPIYSSKALKTSVKDGSLHPRKGGNYWRFYPGVNSDTIVFSVNTMRSNADYADGGKWLGIGGGQPPHPNGDASQPPDYDEGFKTRIMWHKDGSLKFYSYHYNMTNTKYGQVSTWQIPYTPTPGEWFNVSFMAVQNTYTGTTENADGYIKVFINGEWKHTFNNLILLTYPNRNDGFDQMVMDCFFGAGVAASEAGYFLFDDIYVFEYRTFPTGTTISLPNWPKE